MDKELRDKVLARFNPIIRYVDCEPSIVIWTNNTNIITGAVVSAALPVRGFLELFGDLVEKDIWNSKVYRKRNIERSYGIPSEVFDVWEDNGFLD